MKLTVEPLYQDYFHKKTTRRTWGCKHFIAGQAGARVQKANKHEHRRTLKGLLFVFCLLAATIISRESMASEQALAGELHFVSTDGQKRQALHLDSAAEFNIKGLHAQVRLTQSFTNKTNQWVEGVYVFPLPQDSAVNAMKMVIGERIITAEVREREEAKKIYLAAKRAGKKTALMEQERPNLFTQSIANIGPGETIKITLEYLQPVRYDMGKLSIRFPMTITERYIPGTLVPGSVVNADDIVEHASFKTRGQGWATDEVVDASRITPVQTEHKNQISLSVNLDAGMVLSFVNSPSHMLNTQINNDKTYHITTQEKTVAMDKDFELVWHPKEANAPKAAVFHEEMDGESYIQLMLLPPYVESELSSSLPREFVLVVDTSGSMQGRSIIQAKKSVALALKRLKPTDYFNVIEFNSAHSALFSKPKSAHRANIETALNFVGGLQANGGTNMAPALKEALQSQSNEELLRQVVFITDGAVGNEQALFQLIHKHLASSRLFTVGIGSAPNSHFMEKAAQFGRGTFTHISTASQMDERMGELFRKLENPVMSGIEVNWPRGWEIEVYPKRIPDLYLGEPMLITAKISPQMTGQEQVVINGEIIGKSWRRELSIPTPKIVYIQDKDSTENNEDTKAIIPSYWARFKISHLLDQKTLGGNLQTIKEQVLPVALKYQLMSPYTSFIAVEEVVSRPPEETLALDAVPNTRPSGQISKRIPYPQTATSAQLNMLIGFIALLLALFIARFVPGNNTIPVLGTQEERGGL